MLKNLLFIVVGLIASIGVAIAAVNINTATEQELDGLPGVGPVKAKAIVEYRKANGNFKSVDDLKSVKGIGDGNFEKLKSQIAVSGATTPVAAAVAKSEAKAGAKAVAKEMKTEAKAKQDDAKAEVKPEAADAKAATAKAKADKKAEATAKKEAAAASKATK